MLCPCCGQLVCSAVRCVHSAVADYVLTIPLCVCPVPLRVTVVMLPDEKLGAKIEGDEKQKLDSLRAAMSPEQVQTWVRLVP